MFRRNRRLIGLAVAGYLLLGTPTGARLVADLTGGVFTTPGTVQQLRGDQVRFTASADGQPVVWAPCRTVAVLVNDGGIPGARAEVQRGLDTISSLTGTRFRVVGITDATPSRTWYDQRPIPPVLIGFVNDSDLFLTADALGSAVANPAGDRIATGAVAIRAATYVRMGAGQRQALLLHELGHLIGLDHTDARGDLMQPYVGVSTAPVFNPAVADAFAPYRARCR